MEEKISYDHIEAMTLKKVAEIRNDYYRLAGDGVPYPTDEWLEELLDIPHNDERRLGATILFESILVPFIVSLFDDEMNNRTRIQELMDWIEYLAHQEDVNIRGGLVGVCVCEQVIGRYDDRLPQIFPYFGPKTKEICRESVKYLNLEAHVKQYLAEN